MSHLTAIFIVPPFTSHIISTLKLAKMLNKKGYRIFYAGQSSLRRFVELQGFNFIEANSFPFGMGFEKHLVDSESSLWDELLLRGSNKLYVQRKEDLSQLLQKVDPDIIFMDIFLSTDFIVLYEHLKREQFYRKVFFIQTMLSFYHNLHTPPVNSDQLPGELHRRNYFWNDHFATIRTWFKRIKYLGFDDYSMVRRIYKVNKIDKKYQIEFLGRLGVSFSNIVQLIMAPQELEYRTQTQSKDQYYVGFMIDDHIVYDNIDKNYTRCIDLLYSSKKGNQTRILYCALGSILGDSMDKAEPIQFLSKIVSVANKLEKVAIVISAGNYANRNIVSLPENVYILTKVPQLEMLQLADLFITLGGLNSIKESIYCGVPLLVYPTLSSRDQKGNAAKVVYHGLGLRGNIIQDTSEELRDKIQEILFNDSYKSNVIRFQEKVRSHYAEAYVNHILNTILKR